MPSTSPKQRRFMAAVAYDPAFAAKVGVPMSVGKDFNQADEALMKRPEPKIARVQQNKAAMASMLSGKTPMGYR